MTKEQMITKIENNKIMLSNLCRKKNNLEKQIEDLNKKIANQENALLNWKSTETLE